MFANRVVDLDRSFRSQLTVWQSTLPLGVDAMAVVHRVLTPVAATCWPFLTAECGDAGGVPLGLSMSMREPVFLDLDRRQPGMFVAGRQKTQLAAVLLLRLLPQRQRFIDMANRDNAYGFITELLGPQQCAYVDLSRQPEMACKGAPDLDQDKLVLVFDSGGIGRQKDRHEAQQAILCLMSEQLQAARSSGHQLTLIVDEAATLMSEETSATSLLALVQQAQASAARVVCMTADIQGFFQERQLAQSIVLGSGVTLVGEQDRRSLPLLQEALGLSQSELTAVEAFHESRWESLCLQRSGESNAVMRWSVSPMDRWICTDNQSDLARRRLVVA